MGAAPHLGLSSAPESTLRTALALDPRGHRKQPNPTESPTEERPPTEAPDARPHPKQEPADARLPREAPKQQKAFGDQEAPKQHRETPSAEARGLRRPTWL